jgi:2-polyprenyl-3-methyl-5-hydroxy-6-metoxy-1,4-benzoquinol methylase
MTRLKISNKERTIAEFFDGYAVDFDSIYGSGKGFFSRQINFLFRSSIPKRFKLTIEACKEIAGKSILDVGCGPGHYAIALALRGASQVHGIDFAPQMIELAKKKANDMGVNEICRFEVLDFFKLTQVSYNYLILMGFMDYIEDARSCVKKAMSLCSEKAFFSFPASEGFLAWQRKIRYKKKCSLYLYSFQDIQYLFQSMQDVRFKIRKIGRDYWVAAWNVDT